MKGIQVEEDLSRAGRARRRELEKLMRSIKVREPDRRCYLTYDRLVVDDNVYIFNELEGRVERLPNKLALSSSSLDISSMTDTYNDSGHSFRQPSSLGQSSIRRGLSVDCLLERWGRTVLPTSLPTGTPHPSFSNQLLSRTFTTGFYDLTIPILT